MGCAASAAKQPEQAGEGQRHEFCWQEPLVQFGFKIPKRIILGKPTWKLVKTHDAIFSSNSGSHHVNASYMVQTFWKLVSWGPSRSVPVQNLRKVSCIHTIFKKNRLPRCFWHGMVCYASFFFLGPIILQGHCSHIQKKLQWKVLSSLQPVRQWSHWIWQVGFVVELKVWAPLTLDLDENTTCECFASLNPNLIPIPFKSRSEGKTWKVKHSFWILL